MSYSVASAAVGILRDRHYTLNPVSGTRQRSTRLTGQLTNLCEFNVPGAGEAAMETAPLASYKSNLSYANGGSEYGVLIEDKTDFRIPLTVANWTPDAWAISVWHVPDYAGNDGVSHTILRALKDASANNQILIEKNTSNNLFARVTVGSTHYDCQITDMTWTPGAAICIGLRLSGGTLTLYFDSNADGTMETATVGSVASFAGGTWDFQVGGVGVTSTAPGIHNVIIGAGLAAASITDRFNSGNGQSINTWLDTYRSALVAYIHGDATNVRVGTYQGATNVFGAGSVQGRYDFVAASSQYIDFGDVTAFDAATKMWLLMEVERDRSGVLEILASRWGSNNNQRQWHLYLNTANRIGFEIGDGSGGSWFGTSPNDTILAGTRGLILIRIDLTQATDAARMKMDFSTYDGSTRQYGAWSSKSVSFTGTAPAALITAGSSTNMYLARDVSSYFDGKIDDLRWALGVVLSDTDRDRIIVNEANPFLCSHWYPMDGDANDVIGSINGSVTGAILADDGRTDSGRMEKYVRQGQYAIRSSGQRIDLGDYAALDAATTALFDIIITPRYKGSEHIYLQRGLLGTQGQIQISQNATDKLFVYVPTSAADVSTYAQCDAFFTDWLPTRIRVEFVGANGSDATRLVVKKSTFDQATGTWSALSAVTVSSFIGTIPSALRSPTGSPHLMIGDVQAGSSSWASCLVDRVQVHVGSIPTANTIYANTPGAHDIWHDFDGNATNAGTTGSSNNGSLTGSPIQWFDGRKPLNHDRPGGVGTYEVDRATNSSKGTFSLRYKKVGSDSYSPIKSLTMTVSSFAWLGATIKETTGAGTLRIGSASANPVLNPSSASFTRLTDAATMTQSSGSGDVRVTTMSTNDEIYIDELDAVQFASITPSATKGAALPSLAGAGDALGVAIVTITTPGAVGVPDIFDAALSGYGQKVIKLDTGVTGTQVRRFRWGGSWGLNGLTAGQYVSMSVLVHIPSTSAITPANVKLRCVDSTGSTTGTAMTAKGETQELHVQRSLGGGATYAYFELQVEDGVNFATANAFIVFALPVIIANARIIPPQMVNDAEGSLSYSADEAYVPWSALPATAPYTGYERFIERGTVKNGGGGRVVHIGAANGTGAYLAIYESGGFYRATHHNGTSAVHSTMAAAPELGDKVELRVVLYADGSIELFQSINNATETSGVRSAALAFAGAWGTPTRMYMNSQGSTFAGFLDLQNKHWRGEIVDRATMRAYAGATA